MPGHVGSPGRLGSEQYDRLVEQEVDVEDLVVVRDVRFPHVDRVRARPWSCSTWRVAGGAFLLLSFVLVAFASLDFGHNRKRPGMLPQAARTSGVQLDSLTAQGVAAVPDEFPNTTVSMQNPYEVVKVGEVSVHNNITSAFDSMDKNHDGVLDAQNHSMLFPMTEEQFDQTVETEAQQFVAMEEATNPEIAVTIQHLKNLEAQKQVQNFTGDAPETAMALNVNNLEMRLVDKLYTFGGPSTAKSPVYDATREGGCFAGLRVYATTQKYSPGVGTIFTMVDPVVPLANAFGYKHAKIHALEISAVTPAWNPVHECDFQGPDMDAYFWAHGHTIYPRVMELHETVKRTNPKPPPEERSLLGKREVKYTQVMALFTKRNYLPTQQVYEIPPEISKTGKTDTWRVVGRSCAAKSEGVGRGSLGLEKNAVHSDNTVESFFPNCKDHILLMQDEETLECAMSFEGSADFLDWLSNFNAIGKDFCSFGQVHAGFRAKLLRMVAGVDFRQVIHTRLSKCSKVTVTGHSLGGAQAELFSACANRGLKPGDSGYNEYRLIKWKKESPELMKGFYQDQSDAGIFLRNKGTGLCIDVQGTTSVNYLSKVIMFPCELPGFDKEQRWDLTAEGFIVNRKSGKCIDGDLSRSVSGKVLTQWTCELNLSNTSQKWRFTKYGFIQNLKNGLCINNLMGLFTCPFTDQKWEWVGDGMLKNQVTHSCLSPLVLDGKMGIGTPLVVEPCTEAVPGTPEADIQKWMLLEGGELQNSASGLCAQIHQRPSGATKPDMVLGLCTDSKFWAWKLNDGFMYNTVLGNCLGLHGKPGTNGSQVIEGPCEDEVVETDGVWVTQDGLIKNLGNDYDNGELMCVQVLGEKTGLDMTDGAELSMQMCKVATDQKWEIATDGTIKQVIGGQKCLDFRGESAPNDQLLHIDNCYDAYAAYMFLDSKWIVEQDQNLIRSDLFGKCFVSKGKSGHPVELEVCSYGKDTAADLQAFVLAADGTIVHSYSSMCLVVDETAVLPHRHIVALAKCQPGSGDAQKWEVIHAGHDDPESHHVHGYLRHKGSGMCVGTRRISGTDDVEVVVGQCPDGDSQKWQILDNGLIKSKSKGTCLDASNVTGVAAEPWDLVAVACDASRATQQWEQVSP